MTQSEGGRPHAAPADEDEGVREGQHVRPLAFTTSTKQSAMWAAASGDFDPIHYDRDYAVRQKLPGVIVNGRLKLALLARLAARLAGPRGTVRRLSARHGAMDAVGEELTACALVKRVHGDGVDRVAELELWIENPRGERTAVGSATLSLGGSRQRPAPKE